MRTLVLDQGYRPHGIVTWQRAVLMLFDGKVEVVEEYEHDIRSVTVTIKMPSVVRLLRALRGKRGVKFSRMNVATRDAFRCQYCGDKLPLHKLTYDHVIPRAQGGKTCWENIVMACYTCNGRKGHRTPAQVGLRLLRQPVRPRWLPVVAFRIDPTCSVPETWTQWIYWHGALEEDSAESRS
ncbi:MAG TPA: HNH endonuclease [Polyangiales bacterium]|nr:HNH endonuclease [Polyangiales bacterium]